MKSVYINSAVCISAQDTLAEDFFRQLTKNDGQHYTKAIEPIYKEFIPPAQIRRMSKVVKMSTVSAHFALKEAQLENPDAIIVGTGMGCAEDSEKFLRNVIENEEEFLTPTHFIQSTHNTVAGQIALGLGCHAYNFTYVNTASGLEFSFLDAKLQLETEEARSVLVGATDEVTPRTMELYQLVGTLKKEENLPCDFINSTSKGVVWGEGSSFFVLENEQKEHSYAKLLDIEIRNEVSLEETSSFIESFLARNTIEIDAVLLGFSGDSPSDTYYKKTQELFPDSAQLYYKHLSGEFNTASGFATFMACHILKKQFIPKIMQINSVKKEHIKTILLYNHLLGKDHSLMILQSV